MSAAADVVTIMKNMHKSIATKSMSIIITNMAMSVDAVTSITTAMRAMSIITTIIDEQLRNAGHDHGHDH